MMIDPAVGLLVTFTIALLFGSASVHKLRDLHRFEEIFAAYGVLTSVSRWKLSWIIPVLELAVAVGLLFGGSRLWAATVGAALLVVYAAAIGVNLQRGRRDLACGCGGPNDRSPIAPWMLGRNSVLALLLLGCAWVPWMSRPLVFTDAVTVVLGLATLALVYLCIDQMMSYLQRAARFRGLR
jgi:Methylamine utilisation protein MauE